MAKPAKKPRLASGGGAVKTDLPSGKRDVGWNNGDALEGPYLNDLFYNIYEWVNYLDGLTGESLEWTVLQKFAAKIRTASGSALEPHLYSDVVPASAGQRFCIGEWKLHSSGTNRARLYAAEAGSGGRFELTLNAKWNGTDWTSDASGVAALYCFDGAEFRVSKKTGIAGAGVTFGAWDANGIDIAAGTLALTSALSAASAAFTGALSSGPASFASIETPVALAGTNPAATTALSNVLAKSSLPKAWCIIENNPTYGGTNPALRGGLNVASVTRPFPGELIVTMASPCETFLNNASVAKGKFAPIITGTDLTALWYWEFIDASSFRIGGHFQVSNTGVDFTTWNGYLSVHVLGIQT